MTGLRISAMNVGPLSPDANLLVPFAPGHLEVPSKPAILEAPRRRSRPPDDSGRTRSTLFECAAWVRKIGHQKSALLTP